MLPSQHLQELDELAGWYWWHVHRSRCAADEAKGSVSAYLDLGCGPGATTRRIADRLGCERVVGLDFDPRLSEPCRRNRVEFKKADLERGELPLQGRRFDFFTALDVLEHLDEPRRLLEALKPSLAPGARGVVTVPAFPFLFSVWDERLGHRRRYRRAGLKALFDAAGYRVLRQTYLYSFAFLPAVLLRRGKSGGSEFPHVPGWLNSALIAAGDAERALTRFCPAPFGTSLLAVVTPL